MRDRKLTGPWAGFAFKGGRLVTPEGRELEPQDLAWLGLTAALAQEWRRMMAIERSKRGLPAGKNSVDCPADVLNLGDLMRRRAEKPAAGVSAGPDAEPTGGVLPLMGPKPSRRG